MATVKAWKLEEGMRFTDGRDLMIAMEVTVGREEVEVDFRYPGRDESSGTVIFRTDDDVKVW